MSTETGILTASPVTDDWGAASTPPAAGTNWKVIIALTVVLVVAIGALLIGRLTS
jgi:hypothetical protein